MAFSADRSVRVTAEISDEELLEFIRVNEELMELQNEAEQEMLGVIEEHGMTPERYNEIAMMENNPQMESDASPQELETARQISEKIHAIQYSLQENALSIIERSQLTPERFQEIGMTLQTSPELQQRLHELLQEQQ
ncbi:hypothetical protein CHISP_2614 [Chitinispirillum alkaliphilum]|nr:hypothetical protein CHISP_2614 [Chitinispirillum alkaliphilum]